MKKKLANIGKKLAPLLNLVVLYFVGFDRILRGFGIDLPKSTTESFPLYHSPIYIPQFLAWCLIFLGFGLVCKIQGFQEDELLSWVKLANRNKKQ